MDKKFKYEGKGMDKSFIEEQLDLLDGRIKKINSRLGDISNSLKVLHDTLLQKPSNVVDINKNLSHKNESTQDFREQIEALRKEIDQAVQSNIERGLPQNSGSVPHLKYKLHSLENLSYRPKNERVNMEYFTQKQKEALEYYNRVAKLNVTQSFSFPTPRGKAERIRRAVKKFNKVYGTDYQIKIVRNWSTLNSVHIVRIN